MERLAVPACELEKTNSKIERLLESLGPAQQSPTAYMDHMADLFEEVMRVGAWLRDGLARDAEGPLAHELEQYHQHLERLRKFLPRLHGRLLTEHARLEAERSHLEAATVWAQSAGRHSSG